MDGLGALLTHGKQKDGSAHNRIDERKYREAWRQAIFSRARQLKAEFPDKCKGTQVRDLIQQARNTAASASGPRKWWQGTLVESAWRELHLAETLIVAQLPLHEAVLWWDEVTANQPRVAVDWKWSPPKAAFRTSPSVAASLRKFYAESDNAFDETRIFRNRLIVLATIGLAITALLVAFAATKVLRIATPGSAAVVTGIWQNLLLAVFGAIGAFISGLPSLSSAAQLEPPFTMAIYQLALKLATGGMFAMLGILAIQSQFVEDVAPFKSFGGAVLLWGLVFGGAQQLLTGIFDRQAAKIEDQTPPRVSGAIVPPAVTTPNGRRG